jgi:hypothetical protein
MKVGVATAVYISNDAHYTYAKETLDSISSDEHELIFAGVLNVPSLKDEWETAFTSRGELLPYEENNVSRAWNRGIHHLLERDCVYVFVPNLDIVVQPGALDRLVESAGRPPANEALLWTMANWHYRWDHGENHGIATAPLTDNWVPYPHFSAFMVDRHLFEEIGPFDENFKPAYNEDLDMHWRIKLAGKQALQYEGARFYHHGSQTIRNDSALNEANSLSHHVGNQYFTQKWGFKPATADDPFTDGMFKHPFNDPAQAGLERQFITTW